MPYQADITKAYNSKLLAISNAKKIQSLSTQVYRNRGELKVKHGSVTSASMTTGSLGVLEMTLIAQGNDVYDRDGNHINCFGCNVSGYISNPLADVYIVLSKNGVVPSYGDFQNTVGGFLYAPQREEFRVLGIVKNFNSTHIAPTSSGATTPIFTKKTFRIPTYYNGSAAGNGVRNRIYLVIKNDTGSTIDHSLNVELYFRDR